MGKKLLNSDQKRVRAMPGLLNSRLIITCIFSLIALTFYLGGFLNFPALCLIVAGALWNFFTDINTFISFMLSLVVCFIYAMFSILEGLYMNALLYVAFYIPLQFVVWINNLDSYDMSIKKDKRLFKKGFLYEYIALIVVLVSLSVLCYFNSEITLTVFDALTACILGFSAFLQSYMYREYYLIRPMAVLMALLLWVLVIFVNGFSMISFTMIVLYLMYLTNDLLTSAFWKITVDVVEPEELELVTSEGKKVLESERIEEYKKLVELENKNDKNSKGGGVTA